MVEVLVVSVQDIRTGRITISGEGYRNLEVAEKYILGRDDEPKRIDKDRPIYESRTNRYKVHYVTVSK